MGAIEEMLIELESTRLEVVLVPSKRHHARDWDMVRVAASKNCTWYRRFCLAHSSDRRRGNLLHDTRIKRANTIRALNQMLAGRPAGKYEQEFRSIAARLEKKTATVNLRW